MKLKALSSALSFIKEYAGDAAVHIGLNTSPLSDIEACCFMKSKDGVWYANSGVFPITGLAGANNTQKTGKLVYDIARILFRYSKSVIIYYDTESTLDISRLARMVDVLYGVEGYFEEHIMDERFIYMPASAGIDAAAAHARIIDIYKNLEELKNSKEKEDKDAYKALQTETPFWSEKKQQNITIPGPFLFACDSITETMFDALAFRQFGEGDIDAGGKKRTRDMEIGNLRRVLMEDVCRLGPRNGIYSYWVAQTADKFSIDGKPVEKDSGFIRQNKKISAPKTMLRLPHVGREIIKGTVLKHADGTALYPSKLSQSSNDVKQNPDMIEYSASIFRNKIGKSGYCVGFVASQENGIDEDISMYRLLAQADYYGLDGSNKAHYCSLLPDLCIKRTTAKDLLDETPRLRRAIGLCYHLWYLQNLSLSFPKEFRIPPSELYTLIKEQGYDWNEILDTIDYWHDNHEFIKEKTLTIFELLEVAVNKKPLYWKEKTAA